MFGRVLDWIDWFTGYDRQSARLLLLIVVVNVAIFGWIFAGDWLEAQIFGPDCDAACEAVVEQYLRDHPAPPLPTPDGDRIIRDVLEGR